MQLDGATLGLVFSGISTVVVVIGALIALGQVRHLRYGNELATLTELDARFETPDLVTARSFVLSELPLAMNDPDFLDALRGLSTDARTRHVLRVANFFEMVGLYVHVGALSQQVASSLWGVVVAHYWTAMRDAIMIVREERMVFGFFEDFYVRSQRWLGGRAFRAELASLGKDPALAHTPRAPDPST